LLYKLNGKGRKEEEKKNEKKKKNRRRMRKKTKSRYLSINFGCQYTY